MLEKAILDTLIWYLLRGLEEGFKACELIQEALSYKKAIPKSFWIGREAEAYIFELYDLSKSDMRKARDEVVERIIKEINKPHHIRKMYCDNYSRLFHALAILKVSKNDSRIPTSGKGYMYNIAYYLWWLDDGKPSTYEFVSNVAWYSAEAVKIECKSANQPNKNK